MKWLTASSLSWLPVCLPTCLLPVCLHDITSPLPCCVFVSSMFGCNHSSPLFDFQALLWKRREGRSSLMRCRSWRRKTALWRWLEVSAQRQKWQDYMPVPAAYLVSRVCHVCHVRPGSQVQVFTLIMSGSVGVTFNSNRSLFLCSTSKCCWLYNYGFSRYKN